MLMFVYQRKGFSNLSRRYSIHHPHMTLDSMDSPTLTLDNHRIYSHIIFTPIIILQMVVGYMLFVYLLFRFLEFPTQNVP